MVINENPKWAYLPGIRTDAEFSRGNHRILLIFSISLLRINKSVWLQKTYRVIYFVGEIFADEVFKQKRWINGKLKW